MPATWSPSRAPACPRSTSMSLGPARPVSPRAGSLPERQGGWALERRGSQADSMIQPIDLTPDAGEWDALYGAAERVWSGGPNGALIDEVAELEPGRALDVGCGEGADAVWLARGGWQVTALDVSRVALDRA